mgnify:CR=1 FL=1
MKNNSFGEKILIVVIIVGILYIIGSAVDASKSKCVKSGCNNERSSGSAYCFLHKPYENSSYKNSYSSTTRATTESTTETIERTTTSVTTREEPTTRAWNDNNSYKNNTSGNPYKSYDDGYDDVYMDGDYDDDRYNSDSDYADGVDDAIEDDYEEGDGGW